MTGGTDTGGQRALKWHRRLPAQRRLRLLARLAGMSPAEFGLRLRRALRGRNDAARLEVAQTRAAAAGATLLTALGDDPAGVLAVALERRFFFPPGRRAELAAAARPLGDAIMAEAGRLLAGEVMLFERPLALDPAAIDWQADPLGAGRCWPAGWLSEATAIGERRADVKFVWELNRQQYLPLLGRAYWLSDDERYAARAAQLLASWLEQNPPAAGVNWCSHLEVGMRAISWLWTLPLLLAWPGLEQPLLRRWLVSLAAHYRHLVDNLSIYTDPTNHLIGETTALWLLATVLPGLPDATEQRRRCRALLLAELERQVLPDGVNVEQASSYHRFVLDFYLQFLQLSRMLDEPLPDSAERRIERMVEFCAALAGPAGRAPMTGDSDHARALPFSELVGWDFRDSLALGALLWRRSDWKTQAGPLPQAGVWLCGADAPARYAALAGRPAERFPPVAWFAHGGQAFFRAGKAELLFDAGPLGLWPNAAHGHADALSVQLRVDGRWLLADPGTGTYFADDGLRDRLRGSAAHATVNVDGLDQADPFDVFKWVNPTPLRVVQAPWSGGPFAFAGAAHGGYRRLRRPVGHRRSVLSLGDGCFVVVDELTGVGRHRVVWSWPFAPWAEVNDVDNGVCARAGASRAVLTSVCNAATVRRCRQPGVYSECYGRWQTAPRLTQQVECELSPRTPLLAFTFVDAAGRQSPEYLSVDTGPGGLLCRRRVGDAEQWLTLDPQPRRRSLGKELRATAGLAFAEYRQGGLRRALAYGGELTAATGGSPVSFRHDGRFSYYVRS